MWVLWIIAGIAIIVGSCFLVEPIFNIDNMGLGLLAIMAWCMFIFTGFFMLFIPLILSDAKDDTYTTYTYEDTCYEIGGEFVEQKDGYVCIVD